MARHHRIFGLAIVVIACAAIANERTSIKGNWRYIPRGLTTTAAEKFIHFENGKITGYADGRANTRGQTNVWYWPWGSYRRIGILKYEVTRSNSTNVFVATRKGRFLITRYRDQVFGDYLYERVTNRQHAAAIMKMAAAGLDPKIPIYTNSQDETHREDSSP